jgi:hypothetical protein
VLTSLANSMLRVNKMAYRSGCTGRDLLPRVVTDLLAGSDRRRTARAQWGASTGNGPSLELKLRGALWRPTRQERTGSAVRREASGARFAKPRQPGGVRRAW